jgi:hypothetical protein
LDKTDLGSILARLYETSREQLNMTLELVCSLRAAIEAMQASDPGFSDAFRTRLEALHCDELGKVKAQKLAVFDQMIERLKNDGKQ